MGARIRIARVLSVVLISVGCGIVSSGLTRAEDDSPATGGGAKAVDLQSLLQAAKEEFQPISAETVAQSKARLQEKLEALDAYLTAEFDDPDHWKKTLGWEGMVAELAKDAPSLRVLDASRNAFYQDVDGLEREPFLEARTALLAYMNALLFSRDAESTKKQYVETIADLAERLAAYQETPTSDLGLEIGRRVGWLERARQSPKVVKAIRREYSQPNLFAEVSHRLFTAGIDSDVSQAQQVTSCILGTSIYGTANITGRITSVFVPDPDRASFDLLLTGNIYSDNVGYNGPVTIYSTANTSVDASKRIHFDDAGLLMEMAWARCATGSNVHSIAARSCLVRKIAWKRAARSKTTAERLAAGQAQQRIAGGFDEQTAELMAQPKDGYQDQFRKPLLRRGGFPKLMKLSTLANRLRVKMLQETRFQMAAPQEPPPIGEGHDVALRIHESLVANYSETLLGNVMVTDEQMVQMYVDANREVPKELVITDKSDYWAITFHPTQPIRVRFRDGGVRIEVHCKSLHRGEDYDAVKLAGDEIRIAADYKIDVADGGVQLVRPEGDVAIDFLAGGKVVGGFRQAAEKGFLQRKFNAMLKERIPEERTNGIKLQGRWERAGKLVARETKSAAGWLVLGLEQVAPETTDGAESPSEVAQADGPPINGKADADETTPATGLTESQDEPAPNATAGIE